MKNKIYYILIFCVTMSFLLITFALSHDASQSNLPENAIGRFGKGSINDIKFSPDGKRFAVATPIGIWLYDGKTGQELSLLKKPGLQQAILAGLEYGI